jgi:hypothetical protein
MAQQYGSGVSAGLSDFTVVDTVSAEADADDELEDVEDEFDEDAPDGGSGYADSACCPTGMVYGAVEYTSLFPYGGEYVKISHVSAAGRQALPHPLFHNPTDGDPFDFANGWGYRTYVGAENACGQGVRFAYWDWQDDASADGLDIDDDQNPETGAREIDIWTADAEGTMSFSYCGVTMVGSGGVRVGDIDYALRYHEHETAEPISSVIERDFLGVGPTGSLEVRMQVPCYPQWQVFGKGRASLLFGNGEFNIEGHNYFVYDDIDVDYHVAGDFKYQTYMVWELQAGVERHFCTAVGTLFVRAAFEAQFWEIPPVAGVGDVNLGLLGSAFGVGLNR